MSSERGALMARLSTLRLLWRHEAAACPPSRRGPRPRLAVDDVVNAAVELADSRGLPALSIRAVAEALGASPMSVYTYVTGKEQLLELMVDTAYARMPGRATAAVSWRDGVRAIAEENLALFRAHPWLLDAPPGRHVLGPGALGKYERELRALSSLGLEDPETDAALTFVLGFVRSVARDQVTARNQREATGQSDRQWWEERAREFAAVAPLGRYPLAARVGAAAGAELEAAYNPAHAYRFGLDRVVDALAAIEN